MFSLQSPTAHFRSLLPACALPFTLWSCFENIDFPEQVYPLLYPLHQLVRCRQFYLTLILNIITPHRTVFSNVRVLHTTCYLLGQHKTYFRHSWILMFLQTHLKLSQLFQWYIKVSLPHRCPSLICGAITKLEQQCFTVFVQFCIFSSGFFLS